VILVITSKLTIYPVVGTVHPPCNVLSCQCNNSGSSVGLHTLLQEGAVKHVARYRSTEYEMCGSLLNIVCSLIRYLASLQLVT
jgi:hypothetical protein